MSDDHNDYAYEQYMAEHGAELYRDDLLAEFRTERLQSYYKQHPDVALQATNRLIESRALLANHHAARTCSRCRQSSVRSSPP